MKFSTRKDTTLTADQLFQAISDFDRLERILLRRGAAVTRVAQEGASAPGPSWDIGFDWRGRRRDLRLNVTRLEQPEHMVMEGQSNAFDLSVDMTIVALSLTRSRLIFETDLRPRTMRARLILQTAKLGKAKLDNQFERGVANLLTELTSGRA